MIIFDLDGTLADCEHRRHFVDPSKNPHVKHGMPNGVRPGINILRDYDERTGEIWKPDWKAFYEACDQDKPIQPVCKLFDDLAVDNEIEIWSGRCESVRQKTVNWLYENAPYSGQTLKMRPIGDNTPDDQLKERWMLKYVYEANRENNNPNPIDFVFDDRHKVIRMWRKYGIFVFNCCQNDGEF